MDSISGPPEATSLHFTFLVHTTRGLNDPSNPSLTPQHSDTVSQIFDSLSHLMLTKINTSITIIRLKSNDKTERVNLETSRDALRILPPHSFITTEQCL